MNSFCPAIAKLGFDGAPSEVKPGLIKVVAQLVGSGHPDHHGSCVSDQAEAFLALANRFLSPTAFADIPDDHCKEFAPVGFDLGDRGLDGEFCPIGSQGPQRAQGAH